MLDETIQRPPQTNRRSYSFGRFVLHGRERQFLADGEPIALGSRAFEVLLMLVESAGDLVIKGDILDRAWSGVAVEENNLQVQISTLRRVLGPDRHWIVTIAGHGYRFTAPVIALSHKYRTASYVPAHAFGDTRFPVTAKRNPPRLSILVLPLVNHCDDPARDWFTEAMTDSLMTDLARVLPSCTFCAHTGQHRAGPAAEYSRDRQRHDVRYVLKGSMLLAGE